MFVTSRISLQINRWNCEYINIIHFKKDKTSTHLAQKKTHGYDVTDFRAITAVPTMT